MRTSSRMPGDFGIGEHRVGPFCRTNLRPALRAHPIERVFLSGVSTAAAVQGTAQDARDRDYVGVVLEGSCAAAIAQDHAAGIAVLQRFATFTISEAVA